MAEDRSLYTGCGKELTVKPKLGFGDAEGGSDNFSKLLKVLDNLTNARDRRAPSSRAGKEAPPRVLAGTARPRLNPGIGAFSVLLRAAEGSGRTYSCGDARLALIRLARRFSSCAGGPFFRRAS